MVFLFLKIYSCVLCVFFPLFRLKQKQRPFKASVFLFMHFLLHLFPQPPFSSYFSSTFAIIFTFSHPSFLACKCIFLCFFKKIVENCSDLLINSIFLPRQTKVSVTRINKFMNGDELDPQNVAHEPNNGKLSSNYFEMLIDKFSTKKNFFLIYHSPFQIHRYRLKTEPSRGAMTNQF